MTNTTTQYSKELNEAVVGNCTNDIRAILTNGEYVPLDVVYSAAFLAINLGRIETVQLILSLGYKDLLSDDMDLFLQAAGNGQTELVKFMLNMGVNINAGGGTYQDTALSAAAFNGHSDTVRTLIESGANMFEHGRYALMQAATNNHHDTVSILSHAIESELQSSVSSGHAISTKRGLSYKLFDQELNDYIDIHPTEEWLVPSDAYLIVPIEDIHRLMTISRVPNNIIILVRSDSKEIRLNGSELQLHIKEWTQFRKTGDATSLRTESIEARFARRITRAMGGGAFFLPDEMWVLYEQERSETIVTTPDYDFEDDPNKSHMIVGEDYIAWKHKDGPYYYRTWVVGELVYDGNGQSYRVNSDGLAVKTDGSRKFRYPWYMDPED